ncbi:MAG: hypothetical protein WD251_03785 [Saccharospirillum sp.]|uniref:hypothetical protein n=1 Tax=Saccharospirillum sp. TaxID=2033801 RepID=UPI0034A0331A
MIKKKGFPLKLVGGQLQQQHVDSPPPDTVSGDRKAPQPEVVSEWEDEGGRLDPPKDTPDSDSPARGT